MFDIGFAELILLAGLGLIFLGPQRLPRVASQLGRWVGQARRMSRTLMYQLRQEVELDDPKPFASRRPAQPANMKAKNARQTGSQNNENSANGETESPSAESAGQSKPSE
ncbi:Sec-independent protein translocase protein TatB [Candidatus Foliamicus sp.]